MGYLDRRRALKKQIMVEAAAKLHRQDAERKEGEQRADEMEKERRERWERIVEERKTELSGLHSEEARTVVKTLHRCRDIMVNEGVSSRSFMGSIAHSGKIGIGLLTEEEKAEIVKTEVLTVLNGRDQYSSPFCKTLHPETHAEIGTLIMKEFGVSEMELQACEIHEFGKIQERYLELLSEDLSGAVTLRKFYKSIGIEIRRV